MCAHVTQKRATGQSPAQLVLPLDSAPDSVRKHGLMAAHPRPLVSMGKQDGKPFTSWRTTPKKAWKFPEVEYANAGSSIAALVLDCDRPQTFSDNIGDLPPPNWIRRRVANDHLHVVWTLVKPVHRYPAAKVEPLRFLAHISEFYSVTLGADPGFGGVLCHNPAPRLKDEAFKTIWGREAPYSLDDLACVIPFNWTPPKVRQTGVGRNVDLFEAGMSWAGRQTNAHLDVLPALLTVNQSFAHSLPLSEVQATARSIERYRQRWAARGWHSPRWIAKQKARSALQKGRARKASASPDGSNEELRPWEAQGISRATWYRRKAQA